METISYNEYKRGFSIDSATMEQLKELVQKLEQEIITHEIVLHRFKQRYGQFEALYSECEALERKNAFQKELFDKALAAARKGKL